MADRITPVPGVDSGEFAPPGILAGRYVIERELGRGATATVYLARDTKYDRLVAAKTLNRDLAYAIGPKRFLREIEITARLQHPNILAIHDSGEIDGVLFYVTPYLEGDTLRARLTKERQLPVDVAVRLTTELADALHYAHERGIVHRDIKPENILFSGGHACLADFGIAHAIQRAGGDRLTTTGMVLGTPAYMSPEQAAGERDIDGRSDQYSLACVLYEMLAGMAPFIGPTAESVLAQRFAHMPRAVRTYRGGVPSHVDRALTRALSLAPADRFADTRAFAEALARPTTEEAEVPALSVVKPRWTWQWAVAGGGAVLALGIVAMNASRFGIGNPPLNASRVAVLPFAGAGGKALSADAVRRDMYDAFRRWRDLDLVDLGTVGQLATQPIADRVATSIGRRLGAGQFVQAVVTPVGDSVRIDAALYEVSLGRRTRSYSAMVPDARTASPDVYRRAVTTLLRESDSPPGFDVGDGGTSSIAAWRAYQRGAAALHHWEIEAAEREFSAAVLADPGYPQAQLWFAQVASWRSDNSPDRGLEPASRAVAHGASLSGHDAIMAQALLALARRQFATACERYDQLLARDSMDVIAWFGRGECLSRNPSVVRDRRSASGWRFSTSRHAGLRAFLHALELAPDAHPVLGVEKRKRLFFTAPHRFRMGYATARDSFAASPSFDVNGDSILFVPYPFAAFNASSPETTPATLDLAVRNQRDLLLDLARGWIRRYPQSSDANEALAHALEVRGELGSTDRSGESAVRALREARRLSTDSAQRLRLAVAEVRVLIKRGEFDAARTVADSLLARAESMTDGGQLAGLAALTGRATMAARLLRQNDGTFGQQNADLVSPRAPGQVRDQLAMLGAHAALGACDSVRAQIPRVERAIETYVEPNGRRTMWNETMPRALSLAMPCDGGKALLRVTSPADRLMRMQQSFAALDLRTLRAQFDTLRRTRGVDRPGDVALDYTFQEAWLLVAVGDTTGALQRLDHALDGLATLGEHVLENVPQAAALGRVLTLRLRLARAVHSEAVADDTQRSLHALWQHADESVLSPK